MKFCPHCGSLILFGSIRCGECQGLPQPQLYPANDNEPLYKQEAKAASNRYRQWLHS